MCSHRTHGHCVPFSPFPTRNGTSLATLPTAVMGYRLYKSPHRGIEYDCINFNGITHPIDREAITFQTFRFLYKWAKKGFDTIWFPVLVTTKNAYNEWTMVVNIINKTKNRPKTILWLLYNGIPSTLICSNSSRLLLVGQFDLTFSIKFLVNRNNLVSDVATKQSVALFFYRDNTLRRNDGTF